MHLRYETCIGYEYWSDEYWLWHPFRIKQKNDGKYNMYKTRQKIY